MSEQAAIDVAALTFSDTRTSADDEGGRLLDELLGAAGFRVVHREIVREDPSAMLAALRALAARPGLAAIVTTGGTGLGPRDHTAQVVAQLIDKPMAGFGEAFRQLSFAEIGPRAMLSNALAGLAGEVVVFALPGSKAAIRLAVTQLIVPVLPHASDLARGRTHHHTPKGGA